MMLGETSCLHTPFSAMFPTSIERADDDCLRIAWSDGSLREYRATELREHCPCATCREKRSAPEPPSSELPVLSLAEAQPTRILGMKPVGAYAYHVEFSDGHNSGLFTFEFLAQLGQEITADANEA